MGWLGWNEEQALFCDMNAIEVAYLGRIEMYEAIGWIKRKPLPVVSRGADGQPLRLTPRGFDTTFGPVSKRVQ